MPLLTVEINLSSLFDVNIIVFTTIAFITSVVITILLVFGLRPITARAKRENNIEPEKLNITYLRLIMYVFAEFIAFVADMFLVIFSGSYKVPWFTILIFLSIVFYKLVFVLFKDYRDLGFDAKGFTKSISTAIKLAKRRDIDIIMDALDENDKKSTKNKSMKKSSRVSKNIHSNMPLIFILIVTLSFIGLTIYSQQSNILNSKEVTTNKVNEVKEYNLNERIKDIENSSKIIVSSINTNSKDTIVLRVSNSKKIMLIPDK